MRTLAGAAALGAVLVLAACSGGTGAGQGAVPSSPAASSLAPSAPPASSAATPAPDAGGAATPSPVATLPTRECLTGRYRLVRFVAVGGSTYGTGQGGDVSVTFTDDRYTLAGAGRQPMVVTVGGQSGNLRVDGESTGTYASKGTTATFTSRSREGGGTLDDGAGGRAQKLTMKQVDSVIGLAGRGEVACTAQAMTITLDAIRLELGRV